MTLLDRSKDILKRLKSFDTAKAAAKEASAYRTRAAQLTATAAQLDRATSLNRVLENCHISVGNNAPTNRGFAERAAKLKEEFSKDPKSILQPRPPLEQSFVGPVNALSAQLLDRAAGAWKKHVEDSLGASPEELLLKVLERLGKLTPDVRKLRDLQEQGTRLADIVPASDIAAVQKALDEVIALRDEKARILSKIEGVPPYVITFIQQTISRQARLSDLDAAVQEWLRKEDLLDAFHVVLG